jgi:ABC-type transport system involved in multi-copper enzyme maturation permease subunit
MPKPEPNWRRAFGGVWRLTWRRALLPGSLGVFAALLLFLAMLAYSGLRQGGTENFQEWTSRFYLGLVLPIFAFLTAAGMIQDDLAPGTVDYVFTRPMRRWHFVVFRYLAQLACLQIQCLIALGLLVGVGIYHHVPNLEAVVPLLFGAQVLALAAFAAMGFCLGVVTHRHIIVGLIYGAVVELGIGNIPTPLNRISLSHHVRTIANGGATGKIWFGSPDSAGSAVGFLCLFALCLLAVAALVFSQRELAGAKPKDV